MVSAKFPGFIFIPLRREMTYFLMWVMANLLPEIQSEGYG